MERLAFSIREAGEVLGVTGMTVRRLIASGKLKAVKVGIGPKTGGDLRVSRTELERFLSENEVATDKAA
jgi:excisionase family DNA binding protein